MKRELAAALPDFRHKARRSKNARLDSSSSDSRRVAACGPLR
jgi:hypothetical protein